MIGLGRESSMERAYAAILTACGSHKPPGALRVVAVRAGFRDSGPFYGERKKPATEVRVAGSVSLLAANEVCRCGLRNMSATKEKARNCVSMLRA